jgi:NAD(P)-dependent dehydrogenase (short-subunit alcohol dehydrogenase family)
MNSINPAVIDTEGARAMETYEQVANAIKAQTPLGRTGMPEDIGLIAAFLASTEAGGSRERSPSGLAGCAEKTFDDVAKIARPVAHFDSW